MSLIRCLAFLCPHMCRLLGFLVLLPVLLTSCDESGNISFLDDLTPKSAFAGSLEKRSKDITRVLPDSFMIRKEGDTIHFKTVFDKSTKKSYLMYGDSDTIFSGFISRHRDLYFLSQQITDSTWWISAMEVDGELIRGLGTSWLQMLVMDSVVISESFKGIVLHQDSVSYLLRPDKKLLSDIYRHILLKLPVDTIIRYPGSEQQEADLPVPTETFMHTDGLGVGFSVFPNPASMFCSVHSEAYPVSYRIMDLQGNERLKGILVDQEEKIDLESLYNGIYVMKIIDTLGKASACRFEVRH